MCEIASVRVKRPTERNKQEGKEDRKTGNERNSRQGVFSESPENAFFAHELVVGCKEGPSQAIHLTF